ncbi:MAG TPA: UDP-N-acetylmuramoyl-L-alanine--D-glutamate ligase [Solirubrobacteraceae bacterium]|nr:UDP-N-acetylmuramoyl-L-alanine--D-glutamate ligase [Solirubrobacteraceae bacterium]
MRPGLPDGPYLVVGLARSGVAAAKALCAKGERVLGVDAGELARDQVQALVDAGVEVHVNDDGLALCPRVDAVVKSPGVPRQAPAIERALAEGKPVFGELELGWRLLGNETIAVTGTNGKTTTVEWIGHIHRVAGRAVAVAGNVGQALTGLVGEVGPEATIVCEASSFQLEDALELAPEAAVLLNIAPDHLDRHGTMEAYEAAKLRIFANQSAEDIAIVPAGLGLAIPGEAKRVRFGRDAAGVAGGIGDGEDGEMVARNGSLWWRAVEEPEKELVAIGELALRGRHNVENAMAAAAVCLARGMDREVVRAGLRTFKGVKHRLEEVARREGVVYVNDSKATNVASTLVALEAFAGDRVRLILGGQGKGQDFGPLRDPVERGCAAVYLIGEDAPAIAAALAPSGGAGGTGTPVRECGDLERALRAASGAAKPGEVVLLSPACASFDQFRDFEARGERFRELVVGLGR